MICGIEGIWEWTGTDGGALTLNDRDAFPYFELREIGGLARGGDFEAEADRNTLRTGEAPREGERAGKTLTIDGVVMCDSLPQLRQAISDFSAAFYETAQGLWVAGPHPDYTGAPLPTRHLRARIIEAAIDEAQEASPSAPTLGHERPFNLTLRLDDPRYYHPDEESDVDSNLVPLTGEGWPIEPGDPLIPSSSDGIQVTTANPGTAPVDGLLRIKGPCVNPVVSNQTSGHYLRFRDVTMNGGQYMWIDFRARRIYRNNSATDPYATAGGAENRKKLDASSTWWNRGVSMLRPGVNVLRLRGYSVSSGASLQASYLPADAA